MAVVTLILNASPVHVKEISTFRWSGRIMHRGIERILPLIFLCVFIALMVGCGTDSGTNPAPVGIQSPTLQEFTVDQAGGTVMYRSSTQDVTVTLIIPAGALDGSTVITIDHAQNFPAGTGLVTGAVFDFAPDGLIFNIPVELNIVYGAALIGTLQEDNLRIHEASGSNWIPLLGSVDTANNNVNTTIDGFSIFGLKTISGGGGGPDTWATIQADILQGRCVFCHGGLSPSASLSWEADQYDAIVTNGYMSTTSMLEINPGNSATSYMIWKLQGQGPNNEAIGGVRMPASGPPYLDQADIDRIAAWVDAGAPGTATDPDPTPDPDPGPAPDPSLIVPTWYGVQANIFGKFCTTCHFGTNPPAGLSWEVDQYDAIVTQGHLSTQITSMLEVSPNNPNASYVMWKLNGQGPNGEAISNLRMPASGPPYLDQALIDVVAQWISDGALLGVPEDATPPVGGPPPPVVGSWMYVWTEALQICTLCHSLTPSSPRCLAGGDLEGKCPPKDVVLTADNYSGVVDGSEVDPGDLDASKLWGRVIDSDPRKRMPFELDPLTQTQLDIIEAWILDGAPFCPTGEVCP